MPDPPKEFRPFLARYDAAVRQLTLALRTVVVEELAPCHEYIFAMRSKVVLLYSGSARAISDGICNIAVFRQHVTLTFVEGTDLDDPGTYSKGRARSCGISGSCRSRSWLGPSCGCGCGRRGRWLVSRRPAIALGERL